MADGGRGEVNRLGLMYRSVCPQIFCDCLQGCKGETTYGVWALKPLTQLSVGWEGIEGFENLMSAEDRCVRTIARNLWVSGKWSRDELVSNGHPSSTPACLKHLGGYLAAS